MSVCAITLQLFSARKDLTWSLGHETIESINTLWNDAKNHKPFEDVIPRVGYRGFEITCEESQWLIYRQYIRRIRNGIAEYRIDRERYLENFLIGKTGQNIPDDIIMYIQRGM